MENLIAFSLAEFGAMGCPNEVIFVFHEEDSARFLFTSTEDCITDYVPWLATLKCDLFGIVRGVGAGWAHVDLGMGNHLFLVKEVYDLLKKRIEGKSPPEIYQTWRDELPAIIGANTINEEHSPFSYRLETVEEGLK